MKNPALESAFVAYLKAFGHRRAKDFRDNGGWTIDHGSNGTVSVARYSGTSGGIVKPLGEASYRPAELVKLLNFATISKLTK